MRAVLAGPEPGRVRWAEVDAPTPGADEVLVRVTCASVNRGEVRALTSSPHWAVNADRDGAWRPGWDLAGEVVEAGATAAETFGAGDRVVGHLPLGAWAQLACVPMTRLAPVPPDVTDAEAACLPTAGLTALRSLRMNDHVGAPALVTGANGFVGQFAIQLLSRSAERVVAVVSSESKADQVSTLGCDISIGMPTTPAFGTVLESVGGSFLAQAFELVQPFGTIISVGNSSGDATCFDAGAKYRRGCPVLKAFRLDLDIDYHGGADADLRQLALDVAARRIRLGPVDELPVTEIHRIASTPAGSRSSLKVVLRMPDS